MPAPRLFFHIRQALPGWPVLRLFLCLIPWLILWLIPSLTLGSIRSDAQTLTFSPAQDFDSPATVFAYAWPRERTGLMPVQMGEATPLTAPIPLADFLPAGPEIGMGSAFSGRLSLTPTRLMSHAIGPAAPQELDLPETTLSVILHGDRLIPYHPTADRQISPDTGPALIFGIGRAWKEAQDTGWSRALLPVSLIDGDAVTVRNGLLTFLFDDAGSLSPGFMQFSQETAPDGEADIFGWVSLSFEPGEWAEAQAVLIDFMAGLAKSPTYENLPEGYLPASVSAAAILTENTVQIAPCGTRHGPYPFCRQMRHAVGQLSQALFAFPALAHMAQRFWRGVAETPIDELLPELPTGDGLEPIRVRDLIDHSSGLTATTAFPADPTKDTPTVFLEKVVPIVANRREPGGMTTPLPLNSALLAITLDRISRTRLGQGRGLLWLLRDRFLTGIGISTIVTRVHSGHTTDSAIPDLHQGFFPTTDEIIRLLLAVQDARNPETRNDLARAMVEQAVRSKADGFGLGFARQSLPDCAIPLPVARDDDGSIVLLASPTSAAFLITDDAESPGWDTLLNRVTEGPGFCRDAS